MRIAIVSQSYPPLVNGQATFAGDLATGMAERDHRVLVVTPAPTLHEAASQVGNLRLHRLPGIGVRLGDADVAITVRPTDRLARLFREFAPDVVHVQDHFPLCRAASAEARRQDVPLVATNHFMPRNFTAYAPLPGPVRSVTEEMLWATVRGVFRDARAVTTPTATAAGLLVRHGVAAAPVPISCGVDLERFRPRGQADRMRLLAAQNLPDTALLVLYVGRLDPEKRVDVLIEAMARARDPRLHLLVAGRGVARRRLVALRDRLGLSRRVQFLGFVPDSELPGLFDAADIFAMPSDAELQSIATLQALAVGLPVVAANAVALPELVHPGRNGLLVAPGDPEELARCLDALAGDPAGRAAMGREARLVAAGHDRRQMIERYERLYVSVVAGVAPKRAGRLSQAAGRS